MTGRSAVGAADRANSSGDWPGATVGALVRLRADPTLLPTPGTALRPAPLGLLLVAPPGPLAVPAAATPPSDARYSLSDEVSTWRICDGRTAIVAPPALERANRTVPRSRANAVALS